MSHTEVVMTKTINYKNYGKCNHCLKRSKSVGKEDKTFKNGDSFLKMVMRIRPSVFPGPT